MNTFEKAAREYVVEEDRIKRLGFQNSPYDNHIHKAVLDAETAIYEFNVFKYLQENSDANERDIILGETKKNIFAPEYEIKVNIENSIYTFTLPFLHNVKSSKKQSTEGSIVNYLMKYTINDLIKNNSIKFIDEPAIIFNIYHNIKLCYAYDWDNINIKYMQDVLSPYIISDDSMNTLHPVLFNEIRGCEDEHIDMIVGPRNLLKNIALKCYE